MFKNFTKKNGFTLVEMMVAIAVFSVVMLAAMGALINVIDANQKARSIKTAVDNVNFALEGISKDMRMGTDYECLGSTGTSLGGDCTRGQGYGVKYRSPRADLVAGKRQYAYYLFANNKILACLEKTPITTCSYPGDFMAITSDEVSIDKMVFYVTGVNNSSLAPGNSASLRTQPYVIITLSGTAGGAKAKTQTTFDLQTSISQRTRVKN